MRRSPRPGVAAILLAAVAASACASRPVAPPPLKREVLNYRLEVGDQLEISVYNYGDLSQEVSIRPDGMVSFAPVGEMRAEGLLVEDLDAVITKALGSFFTDPQVTVFVRAFANLNVYVGGEVSLPGIIPIQDRTTSLMAIIAAGGLLDTSRQTNVIVLRESAEGEPAVTTIDLKKVLSGEVPDMVLEPYDVVFVPKSKIARANLWVDQYIRRVLPFRLAASGNYSYVENGVSRENIQSDPIP